MTLPLGQWRSLRAPKGTRRRIVLCIPCIASLIRPNSSRWVSVEGLGRGGARQGFHWGSSIRQRVGLGGLRELHCTLNQTVRDWQGVAKRLEKWKYRGMPAAGWVGKVESCEPRREVCETSWLYLAAILGSPPHDAQSSIASGLQTRSSIPSRQRLALPLRE